MHLVCISRFTYLNNRGKVKLITDDKYREDALNAVQSELKRGKHYSLVDMVIRLMIRALEAATGVEIVDPREL